MAEGEEHRKIQRRRPQGRRRLRARDQSYDRRARQTLRRSLGRNSADGSDGLRILRNGQCRARRKHPGPDGANEPVSIGGNGASGGSIGVSAAADEHVADARNLYGVYDLHGLVWEWVQDFDTLFMPRGHSGHEHAGMTMAPGDTAMSCGAAALAASDPENYPMILRLAVLSSVSRNSTTSDLGFRCARPVGAPQTPRAASGGD